MLAGPTTQRPLRPLDAFARTCAELAIHDLTDELDVSPTLYIRENDRLETVAFPRDGAPMVEEKCVARIEAALRDLAIDPEIDAYCATLYAGHAKPGMAPRYGVRVHAGERPNDAAFERFYTLSRGFDGHLLIGPALFTRAEPSWFKGVAVLR